MKENYRKRVKKQLKYPEELKRKIAKEYLSGSASYSVLAEENGLKNRGVVKEFVRWYRRKLAEEPSLSEIMSKSKNSDSNLSLEDLLRENEKLKKQLKHAELKSEMLETMIDVAKEELNIDIRKKSGSNQSKK